MEQVTGVNVQQSSILSVGTSMYKCSEVIVSPSRTRSRSGMVYRQMRAASSIKRVCDLITVPNGWNVSIKSWSVKSSGIFTTKRFAPGGPFCPLPPVIHPPQRLCAQTLFMHHHYAPPTCGCACGGHSTTRHCHSTTRRSARQTRVSVQRCRQTQRH